MKLYRCCGCFVLCLTFLMLATGCKTDERNASHANVSMLNIDSGRILAQKYCSSCHLLPGLAELDTKTWETGILPAMGPKLGIFSYHGQSYTFRGDNNMAGPGYYSQNPIITPAQWQDIFDYYTALSPDQLPAQERKYAIDTNLQLFKALLPGINYKDAHTSFVRIVEDHQSTALIASDAYTQKTYFINDSLQAIDSVHTDGPIVNIELNKDAATMCNIGMLLPNDIPKGAATHLSGNATGRWVKDSLNFLTGLRRPLQVSATDLNNDGATDYLVCEFGYLQGCLSWMENNGKDSFTKHVLSPLPGALKACLQDYNNDGKMDIWVLFAQANEGISLYTNKGNGRFDEKKILSFPAVYGSSDFELADFNKDGLPDIVYTCGDNADYSTVLKPYHGVYIFLNKGDNVFSKAFFFPVHGCYKAIARDFDKDGDLDIATIAYYADFINQPGEGFVYLENKGNLDFHPFSLAVCKTGRWITMDAGDIDGDGWIDLVLGNFNLRSSISNAKNDWYNAAPFLVLKNIGKKSN